MAPEEPSRSPPCCFAESMAPATPIHDVKVLDRCSVAVAGGVMAVPPPLQLTLFDIIFLRIPPLGRVFLYTLPASTAEFTETHVPNLKRSLSLALQRFYPLAGSLIVPAAGNSCLPYVRCSDRDTVELTVAESHDGFESLTLDAPKDSSRFIGLAPALLVDLMKESGSPVLAVQLTVFPEQGVSVALTFLHAIMDGSSAAHFMRTWAAFNRGSPLEEEPPFFDRSTVLATDYAGVAAARKFMANWRQAMDQPQHKEAEPVASDEKVADPGNFLVRATFRLNRRQIEALRRRVVVSSNCCATELKPRFSSFALVTALIWATVLKARSVCRKDEDDKEKFGFACNLRSRLPDVPIPRAYFGNFVGRCIVTVEQTELLGPNGLAVAAAAVRDATRGLHEGSDGSWETVKVLSAGLPRVIAGRLFIVLGSPWLGVYGVDFGWGRPRKTEVLSRGKNGAVVLAEGREEDGGGVEIGVEMPASQLQIFSELFKTETGALVERDLFQP